MLGITPGFLYFGTRKVDNSESDTTSRKPEKEEDLSRVHWIVIAGFNTIMFLLASYFLVPQQLPLYASYCHLDLSRAEGSELNLIFWSSYIISKVIAIPISAKLGGSITVHIFVGLFVLACIYPLWRMETLTHMGLRYCVGVLGLTSGPLYPITLVVFENIIPITPKISGLIYFGLVLGLKLYPVLLGFFIEESPNVIFLIGLLTGFASPLLAMLTIFQDKIKDRMFE